MKQKKRFLNKSTTFIVSLALLFTTIPTYSVLAVEQNQKKNYIIVTSDSQAYANVEDKIGDAVTYNASLAENDILVAGLMNREARNLQQDANIMVIEEDFVMEANTAAGEEDAMPTAEEIAAFQQALSAEYAETTPREATQPEDYEWNMKAVGANNLRKEEPAEGMPRIKVAVLDSGVDIVRGIDLAGSVNLVPEEQYISPMFVDMSGHGTAVASIIAGNQDNEVQGVNPNAELYSVKVLDGQNKAPVSRIIEGIYWCIENDMDIINMSFSTTNPSKALHKAVADAYDAGILLIASSGNVSGAVEYPAALPEVMAVAAVDTGAQITDYSNTGEELEIAAPGDKIKAAGFFGGQIVTHGTSIAVPHITGAASLLWQKDREQSSEFIRQLLIASAKDISNSDECGLLDVKYALEMYESFAENWDDSVPLRSDLIPNNLTIPETFEEIGDDVNYVEGRWWKSTHENLVGTPSGFTADEIAIIKAGAIYPDDNLARPDLGDAAIPYHGHSWDTYNYIASYEFVTRIALNGGVSTSISQSTILGIDSNSYNYIKNHFSSNTGINGHSWVDIFDKYKLNFQTQPTSSQKKYFVWGIALHILGDIFAHETYRKDGTELSHNTGDADDPNQAPGRFNSATIATEKSLIKLKNATAGNYMEIAIALMSNPDYKKKLIRSFAAANAGGSLGSLDGFFINVDKS